MLFVPGVLFFRALRFDRLLSFCFAPLFTLAFWYFLAHLYPLFDIKAGWESICCPPLVITIAAYAVLCVILKRKVKEDLRIVGFQPKKLMLYLANGVVLALVFYVGTLDSAQSFYQENDAVAHLTTVRAYLESGCFAEPGIYPALWRCFTAALASFGFSNVIVASNAANIIILALIYPSSMFVLVSVLFRDRPNVINWGALTVMAFAAFPWGFLLFGPLYPNFLGYALLPLFVSFLLLAGLAPRTRLKAVYCVLFLFSFFLLLCAHPNAVFTGAVFLVPYLGSTIYRSVLKRVGRRSLAVAASSLFFVVFMLLWITACNLPALQGVVTYGWEPYAKNTQAIANVLLLALTRASAPQVLLGVFVFVGSIAAWRNCDVRWLLISAVLLVSVYIADVAGSDPWRHYFSGMWYNDSFRTAANLVFVIVPISALGLEATARFVTQSVKLIKTDSVAPRAVARKIDRFTALLIAVLFLLLNYFPSFDVPNNMHVTTGFGITKEMLARGNSLAPGTSGLDKPEMKFLDEALEITGDDPVLNYPFDGSAYAYAYNGLNVVNRGWYPSADELVRDWCAADSESSALLLSQISADENIHYILLLDYGENERGLYCAGGYKQEDWSGMESLNDGSAGIELVLSEGDMRLYKIVS